MRRLIRAPWLFVLAVVLLAGSEWAARQFDPATADERAILDRFVPMVQEQDCVPARTSALSEMLRDRRWVEAEGEATRIEAAAQRAVPRASRLGTDKGWLLPMAASIFSSIHCSRSIRIGTPAFAGDYAFVTATTEGGISISAFRRGPDGWAWISAAWSGTPIIQY